MLMLKAQLGAEGLVPTWNYWRVRTGIRERDPVVMAPLSPCRPRSALSATLHAQQPPPPTAAGIPQLRHPSARFELRRIPTLRVRETHRRANYDGSILAS